MGKKPRKHGGWRGPVRPCSRLFGGRVHRESTATWPRIHRKSTAGSQGCLLSRCARAIWLAGRAAQRRGRSGNVDVNYERSNVCLSKRLPGPLRDDLELDLRHDRRRPRGRRDGDHQQAERKLRSVRVRAVDVQYKAASGSAGTARNASAGSASKNASCAADRGADRVQPRRRGAEQLARLDPLPLGDSPRAIDPIVRRCGSGNWRSRTPLRRIPRLGSVPLHGT